VDPVNDLYRSLHPRFNAISMAVFEVPASARWNNSELEAVVELLLTTNCVNVDTKDMNG
jgi:hypothetical protein